MGEKNRRKFYTSDGRINPDETFSFVLERMKSMLPDEIVSFRDRPVQLRGAKFVESPVDVRHRATKTGDHYRQRINELLQGLSEGEHLTPHAQTTAVHVCCAAEKMFKGVVRPSLFLGAKNCLQIVLHDMEEKARVTIEISEAGDKLKFVFRNGNGKIDLGEWTVTEIT